MIKGTRIAPAIIATMVLCGIVTGIACAQKPANIALESNAVPLFTLKDQDGKIFRIADHLGKQKIVLYFYPKDESMACTREACAFRDSYEVFRQAGAMIIGINSGSVESHKRFITHHRLPFTLLSDPGNKVLKAFGIKGAFFTTGRETFIIDISGKIVYRFRGMFNGNAHAEKALQYLKAGH